MATSGTYTFQPSLGELVINAFSRCQIRRSALTAEMMVDARIESNLLQTQWNNDGVNLWTVDLINLPLVQGTATYSVLANTVMILDLYVNNGSQNRLILPFSRTDYASLANPTQQGFPTSFWFDRLIAPTISFWPVPDGNATYTVSYYRYRLIQDANLPNGGNVEIPMLWLDAFCAGLAHRLARIYAPALEMIRKADADEAWGRAAKNNVENVSISIQPMMQGYFR